MQVLFLHLSLKKFVYIVNMGGKAFSPNLLDSKMKKPPLDVIVHCRQ